MDDLLLYVFGAVGALLYSFPMYIAAISIIPPSKFALHTLFFSIIIGATISPILTIVFGNHWPFLVVPIPYPLAAALGLLVNPIAPIIVARISKIAENYTPKGPYA